MKCRKIPGLTNQPEPQIRITVSSSTGNRCRWCQEFFLLGRSLFYSKKNRFWPSHCQIATDLDKILHTSYCCTEYTCGPFRPRSARGRLQAKSERLSFFVILETHPKSYIETRRIAAIAISAVNRQEWRWGRLLSWKIPEFNSIFRVLGVPFDYPAHSLQETV